MTMIALAIALALIAALAVLQLLVAAGLPLGRWVWGGQHRVLPQRLRLSSLITVLIYLVFGAILLCRAGVIPGGSSVAVVILTWALFVFFTLSILLNGISRSPAERWAMAPVSAALAVATLVIALG
ncbi:hypothetical protein CATRI_07330 [Corynebacterium atrinae]|uniref:hypothetical protein n=1 Tax=Corynebacterium atrinae TaxID=1336740 RepID=UPI0025B5FDCC|nr:hypothetical protein [Corynebacterium atrinae]WJY63547.1 hypothetical protein CATRI_07330 [Corynebacterium atrinae]